MAYKEKSPIPIIEGGTNATTMTNADGVVYYDGTRLVTTTVGTAGNILTSNGPGLAPTFQAGAGATIAITGDSGGAITSGSFTFTASGIGLSFAGVGTTFTLGGTLKIANGGTNATSFATTDGTVIFDGTRLVTLASTGTTGQALVSAGAGVAPAYGTLPIAGGGTNATSFATTDGTVYFDGTRLVTTATGSSGNVLTSAGPGVAPAYAAPAASSISINGDTGGALTGAAFTFTGGTTGLSFGGAGSTETLTFAGITANGGTVSLATDATTSTINVGTGAGVKTSTFGSVTSTSATTVQSGSGALNVTSTGGALTINSGVGALGISTDASATTISLGTGGAAKTITLGSTNTTSTTNLQAGSGGIKIPAFAEGALVTSSTGVISTVTGTAGFVLTANAAGTAPSFQANSGASTSFNSIVVQVFTSGTPTYTPTAGMKYCTIEVVGGGGGGGGVASAVSSANGTCGGGGGGGGYARKTVSAATIGVSQVVTVGGAGNAGAASTPGTGGTGGTSSVGSIVTATGGTGGISFAASSAATKGYPGAGGAGASGDINATGGPGGIGVGFGQTLSITGPGGNSFFGGGANPVNSTGVGSNSAGTAGFAYGGGGSGAYSAGSSGGAATGGAGFAGVVIITEYIH